MLDDSKIKNVEIFKYISPEEGRRVLGDAEVVSLRENETLFDAGSVGNEMYIIETGKIKVFRISDNEEITFAEFGPGDAFGEMSLIDEYPRSASAVALEDCALLSLSRSAFTKILEESPGIGTKLLMAIAEVFSKRMRKTDKLLEAYHLVNRALISNEEFRQLYKAIHS
ncbi:MAG: cyclic nucleotide-binding domain-containing protein [Candidatus Zixiibacteriota bacterium]